MALKFLGFVLISLVSLNIYASGDQNRIYDCRPDNAFPGQCECRVEYKWGGTGEAFPQCSTLTCRQFHSRHVPKDCDEDTQGFSCLLSGHFMPGACFMNFPRVSGDVDPDDHCFMALDDLDEQSYKSQYYKNLARVSCTPAGYSYPPALGWEFIRSESLDPHPRD